MKKLWISFLRFLNLGLILGLTLITLSCGNDYSSSNLDRERDRQRESVALVSKDYERIVGHYVSVDDASSGYQISADLELTYLQRDGALVPQPTISGTLQVRPATKAKDVAPWNFSFANGTYDAATSHFAAHISGVNTDGINLSCQFETKSESLSCRWIPATSGGEKFKFTLAKQQQ